jgi:hypothetical protein
MSETPQTPLPLGTPLDLKLHKQYIQSIFRVAHKMEKVVLCTELALNTFSHHNNKPYTQPWPTVQLAVPLQ